MGEYGVVRVTEGELVEVVQLPSKRIELNRLRELANCQSIEIVRTIDPLVDYLVCDECGKILDPPKIPNTLATFFYGGRFEDYIVGDVVFGCSWNSDPEDEPDFFALPLESAERFAKQLERLKDLIACSRDYDLNDEPEFDPW